MPSAVKQLSVSAEPVLQSILDAARECVLVVGADMRIAYCNVPAAVAFGREGLDIEGRRLSEVIRDLDLHEAFRRAVSKETSSDTRLELTREGRRKFDVHVAPLAIGGGLLGIGFFYETTQIDRLEVVRQEFLSNISHELRTPLTSILAFVETLEDGGIDDIENNRRFLSVIRRNAERMRELIADILELSLIESGNVSVDIRKVDLHVHVHEVMTALEAKAHERNVSLKNNVPASSPIHADSTRLEQMLTNLIDNAIKFNREGGSVTVSVNSASGRDVISVSDTGEGILPEHIDRIFERLYRTDRARVRGVGGTGLGLAIVKHLARLHGGEVTVESALGSGTTFRIELPSK
ncbi:MAG: PAS domain-containing protein [Acidobacteria bacterium]|nr:PAS domain-containing protein [Acidobacteriota bacterium]